MKNHGAYQVTPAFIIQAAPNTASSELIRYGITASRKIGGAVQRNRARRRLRALIGEILPQEGKAGYDYVVIARQECRMAPFDNMRTYFKESVKKVHEKLAQHPRHSS